MKMPSGAELKVQLAPFAVSRDLYQAVLEEAKGLKINSAEDVDVNFFKDIFCFGFSSKKIEECVWKCMERCLYDNAKITEDTFESEKSREDYFSVCFEVAKVNLLPFTKSLYAKYDQVLEMLKKSPA